MRILAWLGCRQNHFLYPLDFQLYAVSRMVGNTSPLHYWRLQLDP
ncbi:hypothetical protein FOC4_g10014546 [Fusarium odoratissimum]|uniref:Uncharacterized protein n=1 Tax=Fusarium oxysporum f. sp. cubense (strain race 4) TaxID=2502994 RepID=N1RH35_FUSC4|nr:hypothetical protein FOC4_g10014546 [Fusarium odoratissimum]